MAILPSRRRPTAARGARGYTLLAVLLILAALALVVIASLNYALSERRNSIIVKDDAMALAIAETGLERTKAYLGALSNAQVDLDLALDPLNDTTCTMTGTGMQPTAGTADDFLPPFTDGLPAPVLVPPSNKPYKLVANQGGAYLVRIEDNDDDAEPDTDFLVSTSNHVNGVKDCREGQTVKRNPVRDRDQTVIVEVIGIYPGQDINTAHARKSLRMLVGPGKSAGISVTGDINLQGSSQICGNFGDITATGNLTNGNVCNSSCNGYSTSPYSCTAQVGGTCSSVNFGAGGGCTPGASPPPAPAVFPWDIANAPPVCTGLTCMPFFYVRPNGTTNTTELWVWNYSKVGLTGPVPNCKDPRAWGRITYPGDTLDGGNCWVMAPGGIKSPTLVSVLDTVGVLGLDAPLPIVLPGLVNQWQWDNQSGAIPLAGCDSADLEKLKYPVGAGTGRASNERPKATFTLLANGVAPLPHGIWFIEGNIDVTGTSQDCTAINALPWAGVSIIAIGDIYVKSNLLALRPIAPKKYILLAGRDYKMQTGTNDVLSCASGAVLVHDQVYMNGNQLLSAQLVVENASTCSPMVGGSNAIDITGNPTIEVKYPPPVVTGRYASTLSWSESSY